MENKKFIEFCKEQIVNYFNSQADSTDKNGKITIEDVFAVWCCKTLQNNKALLSTTVCDGMYYEVTYNGDKKEAYLDAYKKWKNICIPIVDAPQTLKEEKERWFYFTFSVDDPSQPYPGDEFVAVEAKDIKEAARKFMKEYPCMENEEHLNCEDYYSAKDFAKIWQERFWGKEPVEEIR